MSIRRPMLLAPLSALLVLYGCTLGTLMVHEHLSPYDFDATITKIVENARTRGWEIPKTFDFRASLVTRGQPDPGPLTVIKLCSPELAARMFAHDSSKWVSAMAPCSISVYKKADGQTYIATINMGLLAKLMGSEVGPVLADIAREDAAIVRFAVPLPPAPSLASR
jgi:uncharacterized protein (DUF302 family)